MKIEGQEALELKEAVEQIESYAKIATRSMLLSMADKCDAEEMPGESVNEIEKIAETFRQA